MANLKIIQKRNNSTEITISGELNIYCAMELYQQHIQNIKFKELVTFKLSGITEIDTAGAQLLILLFKEALIRNVNYVIASTSTALDEYITLFNLQSYFNAHADVSSEDK